MQEHHIHVCNFPYFIGGIFTAHHKHFSCDWTNRLGTIIQELTALHYLNVKNMKMLIFI